MTDTLVCSRLSTMPAFGSSASGRPKDLEAIVELGALLAELGGDS